MSPKKAKTSRKPALPGELPPQALRRPCDPDSLGFETTADLPDLQNVIGQPRAFRALQLGSEVAGPGYNVFVLGLPGSGRTTLSIEYLERKAKDEPIPLDWCYVNNFENPHQPKAVSLPAGKGAEFRKALQDLIARCEIEIPRIFESEEYIRERDRLVSELKKQHETEFIALQQHLERFNFAILRTANGILLVPAVKGEPIKAEEIRNLSEEQRAKMNELQTRLTQEVEKRMTLLREIEQAASERLLELNTRTMLFLLGPMIQALAEAFATSPSALAHLDALKKDLVNNAPRFLPDQGSEDKPAQALLENRQWLLRYQVNLLVSNAEASGAPVLAENYPTYNNLLGRIEHEMVMGASRTDFSMIRPGALHRANGGYLVVPARDVLVNPSAWDGLKRALRDGEIRIVELANTLGLLSTSTLEPEPIPLQIKVVMVGTPTLYYLLRAYDEDFAKLFKVRAEFSAHMARTPENEREYGLFINSVVIENHLPPFDKAAVARIIEYSSRMANDQDRLSTRFGKITDLVREAAYWAVKEPQPVVTAAAVQRAIDESVYRSNLVEEHLQELINQGTLVVNVTGEAIGQINALSVFMLGDYEFGRPSRVTAIAYPGKGGVVDIERQAKLGGSLHTKGVLILSGYMNGNYGLDQPLNLSASLTFEQTYDEVQGDSASAAELLALLSHIARVPLRQDRAITGSVDQFGNIQAIGGVNEKIEGFFAVCQARQLTGEQGVIIPEANLRHLALEQAVIQAVAEGKFHVWPIRHVEDAIPLLTHLPAGVRRPDGAYPPDTFNQAVTTRLAEFTKAMQPPTKNSARNPEPEGKEGEKAEPAAEMGEKSNA